MDRKQIEEAAVELCEARDTRKGSHDGCGPCIDCSPIARKMIEQVNAALEEAAKDIEERKTTISGWVRDVVKVDAGVDAIRALKIK